MKEQNEQGQTIPNPNDKQKIRTVYKKIYFPLICIFLSLIIFVTGVGLGIVISMQKSERISVPSPGDSVISETPQPAINNQQKTDTTSWKIYQNKKYGYSLKYPPDYRLSEQDSVEGIKIENPKIVITEKYPPLREDHLLIEAEQDNFECANSTVPNGLFTFVASQWGINKNDDKRTPELSELSEILINGIRGFEYSLKGSYSKEGCGGELFYTQQTFVYLENDRNIFSFRYPSQNNTYRQIIETISFQK